MYGAGSRPCDHSADFTKGRRLVLLLYNNEIKLSRPICSRNCTIKYQLHSSSFCLVMPEMTASASSVSGVITSNDDQPGIKDSPGLFEDGIIPCVSKREEQSSILMHSNSIATLKSALASVPTSSNISQCKSCEVAVPVGASSYINSDKVCSIHESSPCECLCSVPGNDSSGNQLPSNVSGDETVDQRESGKCSPCSTLSACMLQTIPLLQSESRNMESNTDISLSSDTSIADCPSSGRDISTKDSTLTHQRHVNTTHIIIACAAEDKLQATLGETVIEHSMEHRAPASDKQQNSTSNNTLESASSDQTNIDHADMQDSEILSNESEGTHKFAAFQIQSSKILDNMNCDKPDKIKNTASSEPLSQISKHQVSIGEGKSEQYDDIVLAKSSVSSQNSVSPDIIYNMKYTPVPMRHTFPTVSAANSEIICTHTISNKLEPGTTTISEYPKTSQDGGCQSPSTIGVITDSITQTCPTFPTATSEVTINSPVCKSSESSTAARPASLKRSLIECVVPNSVTSTCPTSSAGKNEVSSNHLVCDNSEANLVAWYNPQLKSSVNDFPHSFTKSILSDSLSGNQQQLAMHYKISNNYNAEFEKYILGKKCSQSQNMVEVASNGNDGVQAKTEPTCDSYAISSCISSRNETNVPSTPNSSEVSSNVKSTFQCHAPLTDNPNIKDMSGSPRIQTGNKITSPRLVENLAGSSESQLQAIRIAPTLKEMVRRKIVANMQSSDIDCTDRTYSPPPYTKPGKKYDGEKHVVKEAPGNFPEVLGPAPVSQSHTSQFQRYSYPTTLDHVENDNAVITIPMHSSYFQEELMSNDIQQHIKHRDYHLRGRGSQGKTRPGKQKHISTILQSKELDNGMQSFEPLIVDDTSIIPKTGRGSRGGRMKANTRLSRCRGKGYHKVNSGLNLARNTVYDLDSTGMGTDMTRIQTSQRGQLSKRRVRRQQVAFPARRAQSMPGQWMPLSTIPYKAKTTEDERLSMLFRKENEPITLPLDYPPIQHNLEGAPPAYPRERSIAAESVDQHCSQSNADQECIPRKMCLSRNTTLKSLINRPSLLPVQPYGCSTDYKMAKTISCILSEQESQGSTDTSLSPLASLNNMSTSLPEPNHGNWVHPPHVSCSHKSHLPLAISPSVLPSTAYLHSHLKSADSFSPAISITPSSVSHTALSPASTLGNGLSNNKVTCPVSVPLSSHNSSSTQANVTSILSPNIEHTSASSLTGVIPKLMEFLQHKKLAGTMDMSTTENPNNSLRNVIDLTDNSEALLQVSTGLRLPNVPCTSQYAGKSPPPYHASKVCVPVSQIPLDFNTTKSASKMAKFEPPVQMPISLPKNMYCSQPIPVSQAGSSVDSNMSQRGSQTFAAIHAPTVLSLLNQKPVNSPSLQRTHLQTNSTPPGHSAKRSQKPGHVEKSKANVKQPVKAHQGQWKETLRLTHVMTPPPAHTKPCASDILIEPAPPDIPLGHVNMFSDEKLRVNDISRHTKTQEQHFAHACDHIHKEKPTSIPTTPPISYALNSMEKEGSASPHNNKCRCVPSQNTGISDKGVYPSACQHKTNTETKVKTTLPRDSSQIQNLHSNTSHGSSFNSQAQGSFHIKNRHKYIPNIPAPKRAISLATNKMLMSCPHPTSDHGFHEDDLCSTSPKATLQKRCCQHLTGIPPMAHTKVSSEVREEIPLDLTASILPSPIIDMGLDLSYKPLQHPHSIRNNLSRAPCAIVSDTGRKSNINAISEFHLNNTLPASITESKTKFLPKDVDYYRIDPPSTGKIVSMNIAHKNLEIKQCSTVVIGQQESHQNEETERGNTELMQETPTEQQIPLVDSHIKPIGDAERPFVGPSQQSTVRAVAVEQLQTFPGVVQSMTVKVSENIPVEADKFDISKMSPNEPNIPGEMETKMPNQTVSTEFVQLDTVMVAQRQIETAELLAIDLASFHQEGTTSVNVDPVPVWQKEAKSSQLSIGPGGISQEKSIQLDSMAGGQGVNKMVKTDMTIGELVVPGQIDQSVDDNTLLNSSQKRPGKAYNKNPKFLKQTETTDFGKICNTVPLSQVKHWTYGKRKPWRAAKRGIFSPSQELTDIALPADQLVANPALVAPLSALVTPLLLKRPAGRTKRSGKRQKKRVFTVVKRKRNSQKDPSRPKRKYTKKIEIEDKFEATTETLLSGRPRRSTVSLGAYRKLCSCTACSNFVLPKRRRSKESASSSSTSSTPSSPPVHTKQSMLPLVSELSDNRSPSITKSDITSERSTKEPKSIDTKIVTSDPKIQTSKGSPIMNMEKQVPVHLDDYIKDNVDIISGPVTQYQMQDEKQHKTHHSMQHGIKDVPKENVSNQVITINIGDPLEKATQLDLHATVTGEKNMLELTSESGMDEFTLIKKLNESTLCVKASSVMDIKPAGTVIGTITTINVSEDNQDSVIINNERNNTNEVATIKVEMESGTRDNVDNESKKTNTEGNINLIPSDSEGSGSTTSCLDMGISDIKSKAEPEHLGFQVKLECPKENSFVVEQPEGLIEHGLPKLSSESDSDLELPSFSAYLAQANTDCTSETQNEGTKQNEAIMDSSRCEFRTRGRRRKRKGRKSVFTKPKLVKKTKRNRSKEATVTNRLLEVIDELPDIHPVIQEPSSLLVTDNNTVALSTNSGEATCTKLQREKIFDISPYINLIKPCHVIVEQLQPPVIMKRIFNNRGPKSRKRRVNCPIDLATESNLKYYGTKRSQRHSLKQDDSSQSSDAMPKKCLWYSGSESSTSAYSDGDTEPINDFFNTKDIDIKNVQISPITDTAFAFHIHSTFDEENKTSQVNNLDECENKFSLQPTYELPITSILPDTCVPTIFADTELSTITQCVQSKALTENTIYERSVPTEPKPLTDDADGIFPTKRRVTRSLLALNAKRSEDSFVNARCPLVNHKSGCIVYKGDGPMTEVQDENAIVKADVETKQNPEFQDMLVQDKTVQKVEGDIEVDQGEKLNLKNDAKVSEEVQKEEFDSQESTDTDFKNETEIQNNVQQAGFNADVGEQAVLNNLLHSHNDDGDDEDEGTDDDATIELDTSNEGINVQADLIKDIDSSTDGLDVQADVLKAGNDAELHVRDAQEYVNEDNVNIQDNIQVQDQDVKDSIRVQAETVDAITSEEHDKSEHNNVCTYAVNDNSDGQLDLVDDTQIQAVKDNSYAQTKIRIDEVKDGLNVQSFEGNHNMEDKDGQAHAIMNNLCTQSEKLDPQNDTLKPTPDIQAIRLNQSPSDVNVSQSENQDAQFDVTKDNIDSSATHTDALTQKVNYFIDGQTAGLKKQTVVMKVKIDCNHTEQNTQSGVLSYSQEEGLDDEFDDLIEWEGNDPQLDIMKDNIDSQQDKLVVHSDVINVPVNDQDCTETQVGITKTCLNIKVFRLEDVNSHISNVQVDGMQSITGDVVLTAQANNEGAKTRVVKESTLSKIDESNSLDIQPRKIEAQTIMIDKQDMSLGFVQQSIDVQMDGVKTLNANVNGKKESKDQPNLFDVFTPILRLGGLQSETQSIQKEKQISMKTDDMENNSMIKVKPFNIGKTCYVGLRELDNMIVEPMDKDVLGNTPPKVSKDLDSAFLESNYDRVNSNLSKKINNKPAPDLSKPSSTANNQESILEMLQREMSENRPICVPSDHNDDEDENSKQIDDSIMPPLIPKMERKDKIKQSPLWGYLGRVLHRNRKLLKSQKGRRSPSPSE